jgi:hypothetical protein
VELARNLAQVRFGGRKDLVARLLDVQETEIRLATPTGREQQVIPEVGAPIDVGLLTTDGTVWFTGVVAGFEPGGSGPSVQVRLVGRTVMHDRRRDPRAPDSLPVEITSFGSSEPIAGQLVDVSASGFRVQAPLALDVAETVQVVVHVPDGEPIRVTARVVHVETDGASFELQLATAAARERLVRNAFQRLLQTKRAASG